jgi:hypothetical protein
MNKMKNKKLMEIENCDQCRYWTRNEFFQYICIKTESKIKNWTKFNEDCPLKNKEK